MSTKLFLIASSLLMAMSCVNVGQTMEDNEYNNIDNNINIRLVKNDELLLENQSRITSNQNIINKNLINCNNTICRNQAILENNIKNIRNNLDQKFYGMRYENNDITGFKDSEQKVKNKIIGKYIQYTNEIEIDQQLIAIINNLYNEIHDKSDFFFKIIDDIYDTKYSLDDSKLSAILKSIENILDVIQNDQLDYDSIKKEISAIKCNLYFLKRIVKRLEGLLESKGNIPQITNIKTQLKDIIMMEWSHDDINDFKEFKRKVTKCIQSIEEWNKSYEINNITSNMVEKDTIDFAYKNFFNTCMDFVCGRANHYDVCHAIKCVLYDNVTIAQKQVKNPLLQEYLTWSLNIFINDIIGIQEYLNELQIEYFKQKQEDDLVTNYDEDDYQENIEEELNVNNKQNEKPVYSKFLNEKNGIENKEVGAKDYNNVNNIMTRESDINVISEKRENEEKPDIKDFNYMKDVLENKNKYLDNNGNKRQEISKPHAIELNKLKGIIEKYPETWNKLKKDKLRKK